MKEYLLLLTLFLIGSTITTGYYIKQRHSYNSIPSSESFETEEWDYHHHLFGNHHPGRRPNKRPHHWHSDEHDSDENKIDIDSIDEGINEIDNSLGSDESSQSQNDSDEEYVNSSDIDSSEEDTGTHEIGYDERPHKGDDNIEGDVNETTATPGSDEDVDIDVRFGDTSSEEYEIVKPETQKRTEEDALREQTAARNALFDEVRERYQKVLQDKYHVQSTRPKDLEIVKPETQKRTDEDVLREKIAARNALFDEVRERYKKENQDKYHMTSTRPRDLEKIAARNALFDEVRERYKKENQDKYKVLSRRQRDLQAIPEAPQLPELNLDELPEFIRKILAAENVAEGTQKPDDTEEYSKEYSAEDDDDDDELETNREDAEDVFIRDIENKIQEALGNSDSIEETYENEAPRTYGMKLIGDSGYVWNDLWSNPGFSYDVGNQDKHQTVNFGNPYNNEHYEPFATNEESTENSDETSETEDDLNDIYVHTNKDKPKSTENNDKKEIEQAKKQTNKDKPTSSEKNENKKEQTKKAKDSSPQKKEPHQDKSDKNLSKKRPLVEENDVKVEKEREKVPSKKNEKKEVEQATERPKDSSHLKKERHQNKNLHRERPLNEEKNVKEVEKESNKAHKDSIGPKEELNKQNKSGGDKKNVMSKDKNEKISMKDAAHSEDKELKKPSTKPAILDELLQDREFWKWLEEWTATYMEFLFKQIKRMVHDELTRQLNNLSDMSRKENSGASENDVPLTSTKDKSEDENKVNQGKKLGEQKEGPKETQSRKNNPSESEKDQLDDENIKNNQSNKLNDKKDEKEQKQPNAKPSDDKKDTSQEQDKENNPNNQEPYIKDGKLIIEGKEIPLTHTSNLKSKHDKKEDKKHKEKIKLPFPSIIKPNKKNKTENITPPIIITPPEDGQGNIYGNSVGNDKVTNIFVFYPNKDLQSVIEDIKPITNENIKQDDNIDKNKKHTDNTEKDKNTDKNHDEKEKIIPTDSNLDKVNITLESKSEKKTDSNKQEAKEEITAPKKESNSLNENKTNVTNVTTEKSNVLNVEAQNKGQNETEQENSKNKNKEDKLKPQKDETRLEDSHKKQLDEKNKEAITEEKDVTNDQLKKDKGSTEKKVKDDSKQSEAAKSEDKKVDNNETDSKSGSSKGTDDLSKNTQPDIKDIKEKDNKSNIDEKENKNVTAQSELAKGNDSTIEVNDKISPKGTDSEDSKANLEDKKGVTEANTKDLPKDPKVKEESKTDSENKKDQTKVESSGDKKTEDGVKQKDSKDSKTEEKSEKEDSSKDSADKLETKVTEN